MLQSPQPKYYHRVGYRIAQRSHKISNHPLIAEYSTNRPFVAPLFIFPNTKDETKNERAGTSAPERQRPLAQTTTSLAIFPLSQPFVDT